LATLQVSIVEGVAEGLAPAPSPPSLKAAMHAHLGFVSEDPSASLGLVDLLRPTITLAAAASLVAATSDTVRHALRPEETLLERRIERAWQESREAMSDGTSVMIDAVVGSKLRVRRAVEDAAGAVTGTVAGAVTGASYAMSGATAAALGGMRQGAVATSVAMSDVMSGAIGTVDTVMGMGTEAAEAMAAAGRLQAFERSRRARKARSRNWIRPK